MKAVMRKVVRVEFFGGNRYTGYQDRRARVFMECGHVRVRKANLVGSNTAKCPECTAAAAPPPPIGIVEVAPKRPSRYREGSVADWLMDRAMPVPESGCWIWLQSTIAEGYGRLQLPGRKVLAHRLSYETFIGPIPDGMLVLHRCDVPPCINPAHLFLGTHADNSDDKVAKRRHVFGDRADWARGERQHMARFTEEDIRRIRTDQRPQAVIAAELGVSDSHIHQIRKRMIWKHVP
jgi:hypothetical protein